VSSTPQDQRPAEGALIDRSRPVTFQFEGRTYRGFHGDTLASALLANGVRVLGRSFKYHRPRGLLGVGVEEPNVLVQSGTGARSTPNVRATEAEIFDGLIAQPVNCWPSARFDVLALNGLAAPFLAAGFYYKTFMWPRWMLFEPWIRKAAGLGRAASEADPDRYETRYDHCDVLVIGSGPAGLAAARAAGQGGARVLLVEQDVRPGCSLLGETTLIDGLPASAWAAKVVSELHGLAETRILTRTTAIGYYDHNFVVLAEKVADEALCAKSDTAVRLRLWQVRAKRVVLATGALERPLVFPGNDRPGVMLASAARQYLARYGVLAGRRPLIFTNNDDAYETALRMKEAGADVRAVVDARNAAPADLTASLAQLGIRVISSGEVVSVRGASGVTAAQVRTPDGRRSWIDCDLVAMSGGFNPAVHLFSQSGGKLRFDEALTCFVPDVSVQAERSAGACTGGFSLGEALDQGHVAGLAAAADVGCPSHVSPPAAASHRAYAVQAVWQVQAEGKAFVDFQNDVTADDVRLAHEESFASVEHLKRYTTLGMAPDQGKTSNVNAIGIMAALTGRGVGETGTTTYRPPFTPTPLAAFGGLDRDGLFRPLRTMPCHAEHERLGAHFEDYGGWARPSGYPLPGESRQQTETREARVVREQCGLFEGSPLGKMEVVGPDAGVFLDRIYANTVSTLKPGHVRYGLMLNELGVIIDDGVVVRLAEDRFLVCTTSGGAGRIAAWLEEWLQCEWVDLRVIVAPVTTAWGVLTLTGPRARDVLMRAGADFDVSPEAFPHMSFREGRVGSTEARVLRVSYTGEVSYEINVRASETSKLWASIYEAGQGQGLQPVGIDAWDLLRTEKGYLHVGADTDGTTTPFDVGFGHVLKKKSDFVGRRSLTLPENQRPDRLQLVGFEPRDPQAPLPSGSHVRAPDGRGSMGYVTSSAMSPVLGRTVAIGMLEGGAARHGETVSLVTPTGPQAAKVTAPGAYDLRGERLNG